MFAACSWTLLRHNDLHASLDSTYNSFLWGQSSLADRHTASTGLASKYVLDLQPSPKMVLKPSRSGMCLSLRHKQAHREKACTSSDSHTKGGSAARPKSSR